MAGFDWQDMVNRSVKDKGAELSPAILAAVEAIKLMKPSEVYEIAASLMLAICKKMIMDGYAEYGQLFYQAAYASAKVRDAYQKMGE